MDVVAVGSEAVVAGQRVAGRDRQSTKEQSQRRVKVWSQHCVNYTCPLQRLPTAASCASHDASA